MPPVTPPLIILAIFKCEYAALEKTFCEMVFVCVMTYGPRPLFRACKVACVVEVMLKILLPFRVGALPDVMSVKGLIITPKVG